MYAAAMDVSMDSTVVFLLERGAEVQNGNCIFSDAWGSVCGPAPLLETNKNQTAEYRAAQKV
jgi:hypothetical protein